MSGQKERPAVSAAGLVIPLASEYGKPTTTRGHNVIPDEAVEAAAKAIYDTESVQYSRAVSIATHALEAAAPHMLRSAWDEAYGKGFEAGRGDPNTPNPYDEEL